MSGTSKIPGWFPQIDRQMFDLLLSNQTQLGDLAEFGVYLGASAVVIGAHRRTDEIFTVVDLFELPAGDNFNAQENEREYGGLTRSAFEQNFKSALGELPTIVQDMSGAIVRHAAHSTHRFVHVDASHLYEHVVEDIQSARTLLRPDGVVVFDDIRSPHTPGVAAAVWAAVATHDLVPFAITGQKLYATWGSASSWLDLVQRWAQNRPHEVQEIAGRPLVRFKDSEALTARDWVPPAAVKLVRRIR